MTGENETDGAYFVYMLRCEDNSLYTGITNDLKRRLGEHTAHSAKTAKYTFAHRVTRLEASWKADGKSAALRLEYKIKALTKQQKEALIKGDIPEKLDLSPYERILSD